MNNQTQFSALLILGAAIAALSFATPALATTPVLSSACGTSIGATGSTSWTPASASSWFTASNWDHGIPTLTTPQTNVNVSGGIAQINNAALAGSVLNLCNGTVEVQTGGSLTAGDIAVGPSGTLLLSGSTNLIVTNSIYLDGGILRSTFTGSLAAPIVVGDASAKSGTISVGAGKTLTETGALSFGVNNGGNLIFGLSGDTGTFVYAPTTVLPYDAFAPTIASYEVAFGTLQAGNNGLGNLLAPLGISTKVDSGATLDFNGYMAQVNNLTGAGHVISSTTLTIDSGTFTGIITGAGQLVKDSLCRNVPTPPTPCTNNTLILTGANTYSGGTQINDGTLQIGNGGASGSILGDIVDDATLAFDRSDAVSFTGIISGTGNLLQMGTGNTVLSAANTYAGTTTVSAGTLTITGSIDNSSVTVSSGGKLSGTGSVKSATVASGGMIAPAGVGGSVATLTIDNNLTLSSGSIYLASFTSTTSSKLAVAGTATITGTLLDISPSAQIAAGVKYTLLSATGGLTGTFAAGSGGAVGNYLVTLSYDAHDAFAQFALIHLDLPAGTTNEKAAIGAINNAISHNTLSQNFSNLALLSPTDLASAADQLSGELGSDLPRLTASEVNPFLTVLMNEPGNLDTDLGTRHGRSARLWGSLFGGGGNTTGDDTIGTHSLSDHVFGFAAGLDLLATPSFLMGMALAVSQTNFTLENELGTSHDDAIQFGLYATKRLGRAAYVSVAGAYAMQSVTTSRTITEGGNNFELSGKLSPKTAAGRFETGYRLHLGSHTGLTPYVAVQYDRFNAPAYTETGDPSAAPLALTYAAHVTPTTSFELGTGLDYTTVSSRNASLHLYARAAYQHSSNSNSGTEVAFNTLADSNFTVQGTAAGANAALLALGLELRGKNGLSLGIRGNGSLSQSATDYFATGNIGYSW